MEVVNIDVENLMEKEIIKRKYEMVFLKSNALFYKVLCTKKNISKEKLEELKRLEAKVNRLGEFNVFEIKHVCMPKQKLYCSNQFVGYTTKFLLGYMDLMRAIEFCDINSKLSLLRELSLTIKSLHEHGIAHTDIYSDNVMSNGASIKVIDFDECTIFKKGMLLPYCSAPQADIGAVNDLILRALKINLWGKNSTNLPNDIKKYINTFDINAEQNCFSEVKASIPNEYPHDWIDELRYYVYEKQATNRR